MQTLVWPRKWVRRRCGRDAREPRAGAACVCGGVDVVTQTDAFMDQLFAPMFIPMKTGGATGRGDADLRQGGAAAVRPVRGCGAGGMCGGE